MRKYRFVETRKGIIDTIDDETGEIISSVYSLPQVTVFLLDLMYSHANALFHEN